MVKAEGNIGSCLQELGSFDQARRRFIEAITLSRQHDLPASEALWLVALGRLELQQGNPLDAEARATAALRIAKPREDRITCFRAEWLRHRVHQTLRPEDADRHRVAYLKKLYIQLEEHRGVEEIAEFKRVYGSSSRRGEP